MVAYLQACMEEAGDYAAFIDEAIVGIFKVIRQLMHPPESDKRSIGFVELQERKSP